MYYNNTVQTLSVRTNSRVRQALARRGVYLEEFDEMKGVLKRSRDGYTLYLPREDLNVFLRRSNSGRCSFYAIGTGRPTPLLCPN